MSTRFLFLRSTTVIAGELVPYILKKKGKKNKFLKFGSGQCMEAGYAAAFGPICHRFYMA